MSIIENSNNFIAKLNTINGVSIRSQLFGYSAQNKPIRAMQYHIDKEAFHHLYSIACAVIAIENAFDESTSTTNFMCAIAAQISALKLIRDYRIEDTNVALIIHQYVESLESVV